MLTPPRFCREQFLGDVNNGANSALAAMNLRQPGFLHLVRRVIMRELFGVLRAQAARIDSPAMKLRAARRQPPRTPLVAPGVVCAYFHMGGRNAMPNRWRWANNALPAAL